MLPQLHKITKKITSMKKNNSWWTSCRSCWSGQRFSSTSHLMFSLPWISLTAAHVPCNDPMWCPHIAFNRDIWSCALWSYTFHLHSQKMLVIVLWAIYIYCICSQTWLVKWLIQIVLQLELICQFGRHYKQCQCQIFMEYTCVYTHFS